MGSIPFAAAALGPVNLRCEYLQNPLGIDAARPRLSWELESATRGETQVSAQILVASSRAQLDAGNGDLWNTTIKTDASFQIEYGGAALPTGKECWWKVKVTGKNASYDWSAPAFWSMGLLAKADWDGAKWIGADAPSAATPSPMLRKPFTLGKAVKRAIVYATGQSAYELHLNGRKVSDHILDPGWTDFRKRVLYQTFDVTALLNPGDNTLGAVLGDGWYNMNPYGIFPRGMDGNDGRKLLLKLAIEHADGTTTTVVSDETWKMQADGYIRAADMFLGETIDSGKYQKGWDVAGYDDKSWTAPKVYVVDRPVIVAQVSEPIRMEMDVKPVAITQPSPGVYIFDMGQNMVGWSRLNLTGSAGQVVNLRHAEKLNSDGTLHTANLYHAAQRDTFILNGVDASIEPHFTYHGYRFVEVTGLSAAPTTALITGRVFHSAATPSGSFNCSNPLLNKIWSNVLWSQRGNHMSIPTDCPQRDERLGWMGDAQVFAQTAIFNWGMAPFYAKWVQDMRDGQRADGQFQDWVPSLHSGDTAPAWGDAGVIIPWRLYQNYGDLRLIKEHFSAVKRWVDQTHANNPNHLWINKRGNDCGDWMDGSKVKVPGYAYPVGGEVPKEVFATLFFYNSAMLCAKMAGASGLAADAQTYGALANDIRTAFNSSYVNASSGVIQGNSQAGYALALQFEILPEDIRAKAAEHMNNEVVNTYDTRMSTGFNATLPLLMQLTRWGYNETAYKLAESRRLPSWGYCIDKGATTIWEVWWEDFDKPSFNHYAFGAVGEWFYRVILGINYDESQPGYKHFSVKPQPGGSLTSAEGSYKSISGEIRSQWALKANGVFTLNVTVPANTTAEISLPKRNDSADWAVHERQGYCWRNGAYQSGVAGITGGSGDSQWVTFTVGSGDYSFEAGSQAALSVAGAGKLPVGATGPELEKNFLSPPDAARPWVYWFWLNGNITSNGITADLEAMKRAGIGGALIMEVDQGAPVGPVDFMGQTWRDLFRHAHTEANRLGLEINMNNDAGWEGSGGPWIKPEQSMQEVTWSETNVAGPLHFDAVLPQPMTTAGFYRDIVVQAFPAAAGYRIAGIGPKAAFQRSGLHPPGKGEPITNNIIAPSAITNLTASMDANGRLVWDVPPGEWTIMRIGHTSSGFENSPAPKMGRGLECDKLSQDGIAAHFSGMMAKLAGDTGIASQRTPGGLVATHIDSWEAGSQNWTAKMREEFQRRRGYDMTPFMAVFTGRVVDSLEVSERFLWDVRRTISELVIENYAGHFRRLANANGMRFTVEAYGGPCDSMVYGGQSDEPMGEFWTPDSGGLETCRGMASAGHVYDKRIIGAEAFTSGEQERWLEHPALLKALGDRAFCEGINRFVFHRYAMQPWTDYRPGMTMGPYGQHYERTQTWWEQSRAWHKYLARCQYLLRQGLFVADVCHLQAEAPPLHPGIHSRPGYDWDECTDDAVLTRMSVRDGRIVLPDGMSYRLLALSDARAMTPRLLRKLKELVEAGATVVGPRPLQSPSLSGYPKCDEEVRQLSRELWGDCDGQRVKENRCGRGRVVWGLAPEDVLQQSGVQADFTCSLPWRFIHRSTGDAEIYFVANGQPFEATATCAFRVTGKLPELWSPDTGRIERAGVYEDKDGVTRVALTLEPSGSVFVVFRQAGQAGDPVVQVRREGKVLLSAAPIPLPKLIVRQARYGVLDDPSRTGDVTLKVQRKADALDFTFPVTAMAEGGDPAPNTVKTLVVEYTIDGQPFTAQGRDGETVLLRRRAVGAQVDKALYGVLNDPQRTRDLREKLQLMLDGGQSIVTVWRLSAGDNPAPYVVKTLDVEYTLNGNRRRLTGTDPETVTFDSGPLPSHATVQVCRDAEGRERLQTREPGEYELVTASGQLRRVKVAAVPAPVELAGPWEVRFDPKWGGPERVTFDQLDDWSKRPETAIRYYSGTAVYQKSFAFTQPQAPGAGTGTGIRTLLDLGTIAVIAEVKLNGHDLGILWKPPFRVDVTDVLKPGQNLLEVKVVNLWINRMIGDEQLPDDSQRNGDGTLTQWPQWVKEGKSSPAGRFTFTSWRLWRKNDALAPSGLLGPVKLESSVAQTLN